MFTIRLNPILLVTTLLSLNLRINNKKHILPFKLSIIFYSINPVLGDVQINIFFSVKSRLNKEKKVEQIILHGRDLFQKNLLHI